MQFKFNSNIWHDLCPQNRFENFYNLRQTKGIGWDKYIDVLVLTLKSWDSMKKKIRTLCLQWNQNQIKIMYVSTWCKFPLISPKCLMKLLHLVSIIQIQLFKTCKCLGNFLIRLKKTYKMTLAKCSSSKVI